jgi:hypothetical protein
VPAAVPTGGLTPGGAVDPVAWPFTLTVLLLMTAKIETRRRIAMAMLIRLRLCFIATIHFLLQSFV